jgi:hypothetical protein
MCRNLNLRFLLFYCLLSKFFFPPLFAFFFGLAFYCFFSFYRIGFCFYRLSFFLFFFDIILFMFLWLMWFHLYPTPTCLGLKGLVVVVVWFVLEFELYFQLENDIFTQLLLLQLACNSCEIVIRVEPSIMVFFMGL